MRCALGRVWMREQVSARAPLGPAKTRACEARQRGATRPHRGTVVAALVLLGSALPAFGHNLAPAYLELREQARGDVAVIWKLPLVMPRGARLDPRLPCPDASAPSARTTGEAVVFAWRIACARPLVGARVAIDGLAGSGTDAIVRVALSDGREVRAILTASEPALVVPERESTRAVLASYGALGVEHLWTGLDHLLFVAGLALLLGATRRLVVAISAFTLGHSATLALAALGFVRAPQAAVEVAIAATIVALALSLAQRDRPPSTPEAQADAAGTLSDGMTPEGVRPQVVPRCLRSDARAAVGARTPASRGIARRPALLPFAFGLLHGLGFAGALSEIGLPQHAIPLALFAFNLGIELGQLIAVAGLLACAGALVRAAAPLVSSPRVRGFAQPAATTAIGALGVFWCLDRAAGWLFP